MVEIDNENNKIIFDMDRDIVPSVIKGTNLYQAFCMVKTMVDTLQGSVDNIEDYPEFKEKVNRLVEQVTDIENEIADYDTYKRAVDEHDTRIELIAGNIAVIAESVRGLENEKLNLKTTDGTYAYTHTGEIQNEIEVSNSVVGNSLAMRDISGHIKGADPTQNNHLATKLYVDQHSGGDGVFEVKINLSTMQATHTPEDLYNMMQTDNIPAIKISALGDYGRIYSGFVSFFHPGPTVQMKTLCVYVTDNGTIDSVELTADADTNTWSVNGYAFASVSDLDNKVSKTETSGTQVYGHNGATQQLFNVSNSASRDSIAYRDGSGRIYVGAPTADLHCATKKYVDDLVGPIVYTLNIPEGGTPVLSGGTYETLYADINTGKNVVFKANIGSYGNVICTRTLAMFTDGSIYLKFYVDTPWGIKYRISFDSSEWGVVQE